MTDGPYCPSCETHRIQAYGQICPVCLDSQRRRHTPRKSLRTHGTTPRQPPTLTLDPLLLSGDNQPHIPASAEAQQ